MTIKVKDATGTLRTIAKLSIKGADGTLRPLQTVKVNVAGTLRTVATFSSPMTASVSPTSIIGAARTSTVTTAAVTATPSGGTAPYTYSWARTGTCTIDSPASASSTFTEFGLAYSEDRTSTASVTVRDSSGQSAVVTLAIDIFRYDITGFR